ncbi:uncharacterized protein LOC111157030 [Enhydra lutris kenyoni]|uniref:Uncharacterized protein LOC111157030 n=1 Tax=Enhydra lutris kenyoni TaxID=391180 RepID=A0A2Y9KJ89_ENHLU|nr:uncharacterized protein LOC111157030 [Enhydra lutris kenyoni]
MFWRGFLWVFPGGSPCFFDLWVEVSGHILGISAIIFQVPFFIFPLPPPLLGFLCTNMKAFVLRSMSPRLSSFLSVVHIGSSLLFCLQGPWSSDPCLCPLPHLPALIRVITFCSFRLSHLVLSASSVFVDTQLPTEGLLKCLRAAAGEPQVGSSSVRAAGSWVCRLSFPIQSERFLVLAVRDSFMETGMFGYYQTWNQTPMSITAGPVSTLPWEGGAPVPTDSADAGMGKWAGASPSWGAKSGLPVGPSLKPWDGAGRWRASQPAGVWRAAACTACLGRIERSLSEFSALLGGPFPDPLERVAFPGALFGCIWKSSQVACSLPQVWGLGAQKEIWGPCWLLSLLLHRVCFTSGVWAL